MARDRHHGDRDPGRRPLRARGARPARRSILGGEQSGHVIFRDLATTGDGLLTGLQVLDLLVRTGRLLSDLAADGHDPLPQVLRNVRGRADAAGRRSTRLAPDIAAGERELGRRRPRAGAPQRHRAAGPGDGRGARAPSAAEADGRPRWSPAAERPRPSRACRAPRRPAARSERPDDSPGAATSHVPPHVRHHRHRPPAAASALRPTRRSCATCSTAGPRRPPRSLGGRAGRRRASTPSTAAAQPRPTGCCYGAPGVTTLLGDRTLVGPRAGRDRRPSAATLGHASRRCSTTARSSRPTASRRSTPRSSG